MRIFLLIILFPVLGFAQQNDDYCREIKKKHDELKGKTTFDSPWIERLKVTNIIAEDYTLAVLYFEARASFSDYDSHGLYIKFEDGEILRYPDQKVSCSYIGGSARYGPTYSYIVALELTEDLYDKFSKKRVVKFSVDSWENNVRERAAYRFMNYVACVWNKKAK